MASKKTHQLVFFPPFHSQALKSGEMGKDHQPTIEKCEVVARSR